MSTMQIDELIGNIQTYELKKIDKVAETPKKECSLVLKATQHDSVLDDEEMMMFVSRLSSLKGRTKKKLKETTTMDSKAFMKAMKATWGEISDEESEGEEVENDNLALMCNYSLDRYSTLTI
ncbi:hypothetical protein HAX54_040985 [Datura stramonium]|uniref:UBN2 domain-containing protein n=1 Tax=Datura stramonium TaxID=4076 RepID=A0ABS8SKQ2_DATST|nr:hypothetical protein [Datura stramonium]